MMSYILRMQCAEVLAVTTITMGKWQKTRDVPQRLVLNANTPVSRGAEELLW